MSVVVELLNRENFDDGKFVVVPVSIIVSFSIVRSNQFFYCVDQSDICSGEK